MREFKGDWRDLFFGFRIALDLRKIFLSFVGAIFTIVGLMAILFLGVGWDKGKDFTELVIEREVILASKMMVGWANEHYIQPVVGFVTHPFSNIGVLFPSVTSKGDSGIWPFIVLVGMVLWCILIWSKFGGAITRIAAVEVARDERISTHEALEFAKEKYSSYFWAPVSVIIAFLFFYLVNALGGLVGWIPYAGPILVAILSVFAFLGGFVMLLIAVGGLFGWPLMAPAVSAEGTDAFDAVSRAFSYIYSRPWQYAWYWLVSAAYGLVAVGFVWIFTLLMVKLTFSSAQMGMGRELNPAVRAIFSVGEGAPFEGMDVTMGILTVILGTIVLLLYSLGFSYALSFCYSVRTLMYFILRRRVDNTEMTEVFVEDEDEDLFDEDLDFGESDGDECTEKPDEEKEDEKPEGESGGSASAGPEDAGASADKEGEKKDE